MKKAIIAILILMVVCSMLTACGSANVVENQTTAMGATVLETEERTEETAVEQEESDEPIEAEVPQDVEDSIETVMEKEETNEPVETEVQREEPQTVENSAVENEQQEEKTINVIAVEAGSGIGVSSNSFGLTTSYEYDAIVCECLTAENETVWLYITPDEYRSVFDEDVTFAQTGFGANSAWTLYVCPVPVCVSGTMCEADSLVSGLADAIKSDKVLKFSKGEKISSVQVNETMFSTVLPAYSPVYTEIVSIVAEHAVSYSVGTTDVVCRAETPAGETVWIFMSVSDYNTYIDSAASLELGSYGLGEASVVNYDTPITVHGVACKAESAATGLSKAIESDTLLWFGSCKK